MVGTKISGLTGGPSYASRAVRGTPASLLRLSCLAAPVLQGGKIVVDLDLSEIILLDHFEAPNPDRPYSADAPGAVYHRQDVVVLVEGEGGGAEVAVAALMYIKVDCTWRGPPSQRYLDSCMRNVAQFWDGGEIEVRDEHGNLRQGPGGAGHASLSSTPLVPRGASASRREDT